MVRTGGKLSSALPELEDEMQGVFLEVGSLGALEATHKLEVPDTLQATLVLDHLRSIKLSNAAVGQRDPPFPKQTEADGLLL